MPKGFPILHLAFSWWHHFSYSIPKVYMSVIYICGASGWGSRYVALTLTQRILCEHAINWFSLSFLLLLPNPIHSLKTLVIGLQSPSPSLSLSPVRPHWMVLVSTQLTHSTFWASVPSSVYLLFLDLLYSNSETHICLPLNLKSSAPK